MISILALALAQMETSAALRVGMPGRSGEAMVVVRSDDQGDYRLHIDCVTKCVRPVHYEEQVGPPLGLVSVDHENLIYSVWGTGCCFIIRVYRLRADRVEKVLETGSRAAPSLLAHDGVVIQTYMRPMDRNGRETSLSLRAIRWVYKDGRFKRSQGGA